MSVDQGRRHAGLVPNRTPQTVRARYDRATAELDPPLALVDLDAFDRNAADIIRRAAGRPVRVATKSLRCRFLIERALATTGYRGVMCYSLAEALWFELRDRGVAVVDVCAGAIRTPGFEEAAPGPCPASSSRPRSCAWPWMDWDVAPRSCPAPSTGWWPSPCAASSRGERRSR